MQRFSFSRIFKSFKTKHDQLKHAGWLWSEIIRFVKYQIVGISNSVVSLAVMNLFFLFLAPSTRLILVTGSSVAYAAGDINSFVLNRRWTFEAGNDKLRQILRFSAISIVFMGLNAAMLWGAGGWLLTLSLPHWLMNNVPQIFMAVSGAIGYVVCRLWVFRR